jgi:hypothetical protein
MKTTDKDSSTKQINEASENEKLVKNPTEQKAVLEEKVDFERQSSELDAGEQLDLAFANAQLLAMADDIKIDSSERKKKKDKLEQELENDKIPDDEVLISSDYQSAGQVDIEAEESSNGGLVSEALEAGDADAPGFELSLKAIAIALPFFAGTASIFKTTRPDDLLAFTSGGSAAVEENSGSGQVIYDAAAEFTDGRIDDTEITYSLSSSSDSVFSINGQSGEVIISINPDYELKPQYNFSVIATDSQGNKSSQPVRLLITNVDDTAPTFTSSDEITVDEYNAVGQVVYTATVDDSADLSEGSITYALASNSDNELSINPATGEVSLSVVADFNTKASYSFTVIATDSASNSSQQTVILSVVELVAPTEAILALANDTGSVSNDGVTQDGEVLISNLTLGAKWEISLDNGVTWIVGAESSDSETASFTISDNGVYEVLVKQTNLKAEVETSSAFNVKVDSLSPVALESSIDTDADTITITYSDTLDEGFSPLASDFAVTRNSETFTVESVAVSGQSVILNIDGQLTEGALQIAYTPSTSLMQDVAGNQVATGFTQLVVSDGYIRDVKIYADTNNDGVADESELLSGVTTDAQGQVILSDNLTDSPLIISGGVNVDSGAINQLDLTAPTGYLVVNPLSTLVQEIVSSNGGQSVDEAEAVLSAALGITLAEGEDLSSYDPIADLSENAIANRVAVTQIATVIAVAAATDAADVSGNSNVQTVALENLVEIITASEEQITIDADIVAEILSNEQGPLVDAVALVTVKTSVETMETIKTESENTQGEVDLEAVIANIIEAQAQAIDSIDPASPELALNLESTAAIPQADGLITNTSKVLKITFNTSFTDGSAVVAGDTAEISVDGAVKSNYVLQQSDIDQGFYNAQLDDLSDNSVITVKIKDIAGNSSDASAAFEIDTVPLEIDSGDVALSADENSATPQVIYTATVEGEGLWQFELSEDSDNGLSINSNSGEVSLTVSPDFENKNAYSFKVIAIDLAGNRSEQSVTLNITNLDDTAATIVSGDKATAIDENSGAGQVVYTATADDSADVSGGVTFSLAAGSDEALSIDAISGAVTLNADPDAETQAQYSFEVIATDAAGNQSVAQPVTLDINNVDEIAPVITSGASVEVEEDSGSDQVIYTATASDSLDVSGGLTFGFAVDESESVNFDVQTPNLQEDTQHVYVSEANYAEDGSQVTLKVAYNADASVTGLGFRVHFDSSVLTLTDIKDILQTNLFIVPEIGNAEADSSDLDNNDDTDSFVNMSWASFLDASWPGTTPAELLTLTFDIAEGSSGASAINFVKTSGMAGYAFEGQSQNINLDYELPSDSDGPQFEIDAQTGAVTLIDNPDYETQPQYEFTVVATDAAGNKSEGQTVSVAVKDIDESAPRITSSHTANAIDENSGTGQVVYATTTNVSEGVIFSLAEGSDAALSIDSETGAVSLNSNPDAETKDQYSFTVVAANAEGNSNSRAVTLDIVNLDDAAPVITSAATATSINENSGAAQVVYTATSDDSADISEGDITYSLVADDSFDVKTPNLQEATQHVYVSEANYAEDGSQVTLKVAYNADASVTGLGFRVHFDSSVLTLTDIKDILQTNLFIVPEIGNAEADSSDLDNNDDTDSFVNMSWASFLDASWPGTTPAELLTLTFDIAEGSSGASAINFVKTSGMTGYAFQGQSQNINLDYELPSDSDGPQFEIDAQTGAVTLIDNPDYETQSDYSFNVVATDAAGNVGEAQSVTLEIDNIDDSAPNISSGSTVTAIDENSGIGQVIYTVTADEFAEDIVSEPISFSLVDDNEGALSIDAATGEVTLTVNPDSETQPQYNFAVVATDAAGNTSAAKSLTLDINDFDDVAPIFVSSNTASVDEDSSVNNADGHSIIYTAEVNDDGDLDADGNVLSDLIEFSLIKGDLLDSSLGIDEFTGEVFTTDSLNSFLKSTYTFTVLVRNFTLIDGDANNNVVENREYTPNTGVVQNITVTVNNTLDTVSPIIVSGETATAIDENSAEGQIIYTAIASDIVDPGVGIISYSLVDDLDGALSIDTDSGEVSLNVKPDFEALSQYSFAVVATDDAGNESEPQSVTLDVNNLDEVAPTVNPAGEEGISVEENSNPNQIIYTVTADDSGDLTDGVTFSLAADSDPALSINELTGQVSLSSSPDFEVKDTYSFTVIATDAAENSSAPQTFTVTVENIDELAPMISSAVTATSINEDLAAGEVVYTATAVERDSDSETVIFSLADETLGFTIDSSTGVVTTNENFSADYESGQEQTFTVVAKDAEGNASQQTVTVAINNIDETAPSITSGDTAGAIDENSGIGQVVYTATADDSLDISAGVTFSLATGSDAGLSINSGTGAVTLSTDPDHETTKPV